jgi:betaine-aldehyde dehydrogenase
VDEGDRTDALAAVAAARAAFDHGAWGSWTPRQRSELLHRTAEYLQRDRAEIARLETLDTGKTLVESGIDVDDVTAVFRYYAGQAEADTGRIVDAGDPRIRSRVVHEPVGVCALITPWNYPLLQASWKVAPALAAGNTMVIKPSEVTPLTTVRMVRLIEEAGAPAGVVNLVLGAGATAGAALVESPDVDLVSFTGGLSTGQMIMRTAADTVKNVALELGGKNPNIVFADADVETAIDHALTAVFFHAGQVESGPLVSAEHRDKVESYVRLGVEEGARLVAGGRRPDEPELADGFFYRPTVFDDCTQDMRIVQEETFGPILTVERFTDEDRAVELGNHTDYGLAGAVWTRDSGRAERVARRLRHGTVWINDFGPYLPQAEWGGFKRSGIGRELGHEGLAEYRQAKHIYENTAPEPQRWFAR